MTSYNHGLAHLAALGALVFELGLGLSYAVTWLDPAAGFARPVPTLMLIVLMEFIIIHSSAFMGHVWFGTDALGGRVRAVVAFGLLYLVFALGFSLSFNEWWPIAMVLVLTINRGLSMMLDPDPSGETRRTLQRSWATATMLYLVAAFATTLLPVPELGMTRDIARSLDLPGSGLWISEPHRVVALGSIYFTTMALAEARIRVRAFRVRSHV